MIWKSGRPIRRVVVVAKIGPPEGARLASELAEWLGRKGIHVQYDSDTAAAIDHSDGPSHDRMPHDVDLAIVAGGDGTLLSVARSAAPLEIPILGINFGSLGFLAELQPDELLEGLENLLAGRYAIEERHTLRVRFRRRGHPEREYALLNDAVITKSALARMTTIRVRVDDEPVATYTSDGLIVATPTGSTAYNLSAGGPILHPRMSAFVIAPICPHTMTYRPLVVPGNVQIGVSLRDDHQEVYLTLDGQIGFPFTATDRLVVDTHPQPVRLVRVGGMTFFEVLRRKLRWGGTLIDRESDSIPKHQRGVGAFSAEDEPPGRRPRRREVFGYCLYDFANSSFTTLISTVSFSVYFSQAVVAGPRGDLLWSLAAASAHLLVILTAPVLGAIADYSGRKKRFLLLTTIQTVVACALLALVGPGDVVFAFLLYAVGAVGFESGYIFYNAFLREVSTPDTIGRVSGLSWGTGFLGGLAALLACSPLLARPLTETATGPLDPQAVWNYRLSFVVVACFFAVFAIPTFVFLRERGPRRRPQRRSDYVSIGFQRVGRTLRDLRHYPGPAKFVLAALFFTAGIETTIKFSAIYATVTFGIRGAELTALFVLANIAAAPGTLAAGWFADRLGTRRALAITLLAWFALLLLGATATTRLTIWVMASGVAIAMGSTQAIGRSLMAQLTPEGRGAEFFGFYLLCNKLGAILGLLAFGVVSWASGSQRAALLAVSPSFLVALGLLMSGKRQAKSLPQIKLTR